MKRRLLSFLCVVFMTFAFCGCASTKENDDMTHEMTVVDSTEEYMILRNDKTGVCYLFQRFDRRGGVCVMVNSDGTPYVIPDKDLN